MKYFILAACLLAAPALSNAQQSNPAIKSFFDKYSEIEDVLDINLSGGILKLISGFSEREEGAAANPVEKISYLRILVMEDGNPVRKSDLVQLMSAVRADAFEDLVQVREGETRVDILIKESEGTISNALLVVNEKDNFVLISLEGALSLEDLENLDLDVRGAEYFKKMKKADKNKRA